MSEQHAVEVTYGSRELRYGVDHFEKTAQVVSTGMAGAVCHSCSWAIEAPTDEVHRRAAAHQSEVTP